MLEVLKVLFPMLLQGLKMTLLIACVGIVFAFIIGCFAGYALQCGVKILRVAAGAYIWVIRALPMMVLALYLYYVIPPLIGMNISSMTAGIVAVSLNGGAFIADLVRGALEGVDPGQKEAGTALGLSWPQTLFHLIVPPAFKSILPGLFNQFIISVKDTALLNVIAVKEITHMAMNYAALSFRTIPAYSVLALFYLFLISLLILFQKYVEKRLEVKK